MKFTEVYDIGGNSKRANLMRPTSNSLGKKLSAYQGLPYREITPGFIIITDKKQKEYLIGDVKKNQITLSVTVSKYGKSSYIKLLSSTMNNKFPSERLYAYLIKEVGLTLVSNKQSNGGYKVWQRLAKIPGINIFGWDASSNRAINIDPKLKDKEETHHDTETFDDLDDGYESHDDILNMYLVATKS